MKTKYAEAIDEKDHLLRQTQNENSRLVAEREDDIQRVTEIKEEELAKLQAQIKEKYIGSQNAAASTL